MQRPLLVEAYDEYAQVPHDIQGYYPEGGFEEEEDDQEYGYIEYEGEEYENEEIEGVGNAELIQLQREMQGSGDAIAE